jgi:hypothetical protein
MLNFTVGGVDAEDKQLHPGRHGNYMVTPHTLWVLAFSRDGYALPLQYKVASIRDDYRFAEVFIRSRRSVGCKVGHSQGETKIQFGEIITLTCFL